MRTRTYAARSLFGLAVLTALAVSGCAPPGTYRKVRASVREAVRKQLGPADRYDVQTSRDSVEDLLRGHLARVDVHGVNVRPAPGFVLDDVFIHAIGVRVDRKAKRVLGADETQLTGYVSEASLAEMLTAGFPITEPVVHLEPNRATVTGTYVVAGALPMEVTAAGSIRAIGPQAVQFTSDSVKAGILPLPMKLEKAFDFSQVYKPLVLTGVSTEAGRVVLTGTIDWTKVE